MKAVIIKNENYEALPFLICDAIWEVSKRRYGFEMISRETKHEIDKDTLVGALAATFKKTLEVVADE